MWTCPEFCKKRKRQEVHCSRPVTSWVVWLRATRTEKHMSIPWSGLEQISLGSTGYFLTTSPKGKELWLTLVKYVICWTYFYAHALCSTADPCSVKKCEHYATCVEDGGMGKCVCPQVCPLNFMPVCGSDGKIYDNVCLMQAASCSQQKKITIASKDSCSKSSNEFLTTFFFF